METQLHLLYLLFFSSALFCLAGVLASKGKVRMGFVGAGVVLALMYILVFSLM